MDVVEGKDKKGRRIIEYLIHFQGNINKCIMLHQY